MGSDKTSRLGGRPPVSGKTCLVPAGDGVNCRHHSGGSHGQVVHGSAKTTHAIRGELQRSQASVANLAKRYGINEKTVLKWRKRQSVEDLPMGPRERRSTVLSPMEEAAIVALRVQARLPLDDVFVTLKDVTPQLTLSSLHRCLQRLRKTTQGFEVQDALRGHRTTLEIKTRSLDHSVNPSREALRQVVASSF